MKALGALTFVSIVIMFLSTIFFVASEIAQLAMSAGIQSLLAVTLSFSVAFLILSCAVARLSSTQTKGKHIKNEA